MTLYAQAVGASLVYAFDWTPQLPAGTHVDSVTYDAGDLSIDASTIDADTGMSAVQLSGITHGSITTVKATAVLSDGETLVTQELVIRGFVG